MSNDSYIDYWLEVKPEVEESLLAELYRRNKIIAEQKENGESAKWMLPIPFEPWWDDYYIEDFNTGIKKSRLLEFKYKDDPGRRYSPELLALFLAPYLREGSFLDMESEGGERWGYHFDGSGQVFPVEWIRTVDLSKPLEA